MTRPAPSAAPRPAPAVAEGSRVYAIGDVHGRLDLLKDLLARIGADADRSKARRKAVVYLGDYVDRGPDSKGVIDLLLSRPMTRAGFEEVFLKGNHEDILLRFLADASVGPHWFEYGGIATLASYGVRLLGRGAKDELARLQGELADKLPREHREFLRVLPLSHVEGGYFFVHAGVRPGVALAEQGEEDLLWIRDEFLRSAADFGAVVVHGHSIAAAPQSYANRIGIDTGAFYSGKLTALALEGATREFIQT